MTFRHDVAGTAASAWRRWDGLRRLPVLDLEVRPPSALVVLAAHPDDETLGAGGLIADAAALGIDVDVVVATAGEASHPGSPTWTPGALARWRSAEVVEAVRRLAPRAVVHQLGLPDGRLSAHREALSRVLRERVRPGCWLVAPWRCDAHPDHDAAGEVAAAVATDAPSVLLEYPLWAWHWAAPGDSRVPWARAVRAVTSPDGRARKDAATAAHRSQIEPLSAHEDDGPLLPPGILEHFARPEEVFLRTDPPATGPSLPPEYFEDFYLAGGADPWGLTDRWYERRKRSLTLAALPRPRFGRALEAGCSIGVLTAELAERCDELLAVDVAEAPVSAARARTAGMPGVRVEQRCLPAQWPDGELDLVVLSEVGYYCGAGDLDLLVDRAAGSLSADGVLLACHWRHPVADYPTNGDDVHDALVAHPGLALLARHEEEDFLLDVLVPAPAVSVARATGLLV